MKPHSKLTLGGYRSVKYPVLSDNDARKTHPLRSSAIRGLAISVQRSTFVTRFVDIATSLPIGNYAYKELGLPGPWETELPIHRLVYEHKHGGGNGGAGWQAARQSIILAEYTEMQLLTKEGIF